MDSSDVSFYMATGMAVAPTRIFLGIAAVQPSMPAPVVESESGVSGGNGGSEFRDTPSGAQIRKIVVHHGSYVNTIEVHYDDGNVFSHGVKAAPHVDSFVLGPGDFLIGIKGKTGNLDQDGGPYVEKISFVSNSGNQSPTWGGELPDPNLLNQLDIQVGGARNFVGEAGFAYNAPAGKSIVGFYGRSGDYIDQIGILVGKSPI